MGQRGVVQFGRLHTVRLVVNVCRYREPLPYQARFILIASDWRCQVWTARHLLGESCAHRRWIPSPAISLWECFPQQCRPADLRGRQLQATKDKRRICHVSSVSAPSVARRARVQDSESIDSIPRNQGSQARSQKPTYPLCEAGSPDCPQHRGLWVQCSSASGLEPSGHCRARTSRFRSSHIVSGCIT